LINQFNFAPYGNGYETLNFNGGRKWICRGEGVAPTFDQTLKRWITNNNNYSNYVIHTRQTGAKKRTGRLDRRTAEAGEKHTERKVDLG